MLFLCQLFFIYIRKAVRFLSKQGQNKVNPSLAFNPSQDTKHTTAKWPIVNKLSKVLYLLVSKSLKIPLNLVYPYGEMVRLYLSSRLCCCVQFPWTKNFTLLFLSSSRYMDVCCKNWRCWTANKKIIVIAVRPSHLSYILTEKAVRKHSPTKWSGCGVGVNIVDVLWFQPCVSNSIPHS